MTEREWKKFIAHPLLGRVARIERPIVRKKRVRRCGVCRTCQLAKQEHAQQWCGSGEQMCINCRDKPSNGGTGVRKKPCVMLQCEYPVRPPDLA